jgi:hypothetical protein
MAVFQYRMPAGIPGAVNRIEAATIEAVQLDPVNYPTAYGVPMVTDATSKCARKVMAGDAAAAIIGFYARPFPTNNNADGLGVSTPPTSGIGNCLKRGYINVTVAAGACSKQSPVYTRLLPNGANVTIGDVEAAADGANSIVVPGNTYFMGTADARGNSEIAYNI